METIYYRPPYSGFTRKIEGVDDESFALVKDLETFEATRLWNHDVILCAADGQTFFTEDELESLLDELEGAVDDSCLVLDELKKRGLEFNTVDEALRVYRIEDERRRKSLGGDLNGRTGQSARRRRRRQSGV